jgi:hypothetical protein
MDENQTAHLGDFCERLLGDADFNTVAQLFEAQTISALLSTKRSDTDTRETLFATVSSVRDFISFMADLVEMKRKLTEPEALPDTMDDPRVHDIYDYEDMD